MMVLRLLVSHIPISPEPQYALSLPSRENPYTAVRQAFPVWPCGGFPLGRRRFWWAKAGYATVSLRRPWSRGIKSERSDREG